MAQEAGREGFGMAQEAGREGFAMAQDADFGAIAGGRGLAFQIQTSGAMRWLLGDF